MGSKSTMMTTGDPSLMAYPILACIIKKPMTAREISRTLMLGRNAVYMRLRQLEKLNLVIKRDSDKRWVPIVKLVVETPGAEYKADAVPDRKPIEESPIAPVVVPPPQPRTYNPRIPRNASPQAVKVAKHFNVPALIRKREAAIGPLAKCDICERPTPLKYGGLPICPLCARQDTRGSEMLPKIKSDSGE